MTGGVPPPGPSPPISHTAAREVFQKRTSDRIALLLRAFQELPKTVEENPSSYPLLHPIAHLKLAPGTVCHFLEHRKLFLPQGFSPFFSLPLQCWLLLMLLQLSCRLFREAFPGCTVFWLLLLTSSRLFMLWYRLQPVTILFSISQLTAPRGPGRCPNPRSFIPRCPHAMGQMNSPSAGLQQGSPSPFLSASSPPPVHAVHSCR